VGLVVGRSCNGVASLDMRHPPSPNEFVTEWLKRPTGTEFRADQPILCEDLNDVIQRPLVKVAKWEGLGGCTCGIPLGRDVRFYLNEDLFLTICPNCDSWATFPTRDKVRRDKATRESTS
jgi:hypothetical protein